MAVSAFGAVRFAISKRSIHVVAVATPTFHYGTGYDIILYAAIANKLANAVAIDILCILYNVLIIGVENVEERYLYHQDTVLVLVVLCSSECL